ncbi:putative MFS family arabinose efflux permease [Staphylococcus cohnii]
MALNSSLNYLGSAIGAALGSLLLAQGVSTYILIYSAFTVVVLGIIIQSINIVIDKN